MFNAAYFAGLEILESQAHSEYFDRYPYGREATMGFPAPDLEFRHDTPYGILIWTSYTDTSLTVPLYSSPHATAEQTDLRESQSGSCKVVPTPRTRSVPDGHAEEDSGRGTDVPGVGIWCGTRRRTPAASPSSVGDGRGRRGRSRCGAPGGASASGTRPRAPATSSAATVSPPAPCGCSRASAAIRPRSR